MFKKHKILAVLLAGLVTTSVNANTLYSDGALDGNTNAFQLGAGLEVADSFSLTSNSVISGVNFDSWDAFSKDITNVDWAITSGPGGTVLASGTQTAVSATDLSTNSQGYVLDSNAFQVPGLFLSSGTYWLELTNATTTSGQAAFWDINSAGANPGTSLSWTNATGEFGPSNACSSYLAIGTTQCSSPFQIDGNVPEPASIALLVSGLIGFGVSRRKANQV